VLVARHQSDIFDTHAADSTRQAFRLVLPKIPLPRPYIVPIKLSLILAAWSEAEELPCFVQVMLSCPCHPFFGGPKVAATLAEMSRVLKLTNDALVVARVQTRQHRSVRLYKTGTGPA
jgi:hypothetical protein